ncbi:MAG: hypothetical protein ACLPYS_16255 [Vulcanimicrobiaceae bacterium]
MLSVWSHASKTTSRRRLFPQWENVAISLLRNARLNAGNHGDDPAFAALFREWWDRHDVVHVADGEKQIDHPRVGMLWLDHSAFTFADQPEQRLIIHTAKPGSESERKLRELLQAEGSARPGWRGVAVDTVAFDRGRGSGCRQFALARQRKQCR